MTHYDIDNRLCHIGKFKNHYVALKHLPTIISVMLHCDINERFCHNTNLIKDFVLFFNIPQGYVGWQCSSLNRSHSVTL